MESRSTPEVGGRHPAQLPGKKLLKSESESCSLPHILPRGRCPICQVFRSMTLSPRSSPGALLLSYTLTQARWEVGVYR